MCVQGRRRLSGRSGHALDHFFLAEHAIGITLLGPFVFVCLFSMFVLLVLRFYGPVNHMGSCRARSVYITTHLLGRLGPLTG